jgi:hypothetical protein
MAALGKEVLLNQKRFPEFRNFLMSAIRNYKMVELVVLMLEKGGRHV